MSINPNCICGGSVDKPNHDCERCEMVTEIKRLRVEIAKLTEERDDSRLSNDLKTKSCEAERRKESDGLYVIIKRLGLTLSAQRQKYAAEIKRLQSPLKRIMQFRACECDQYHCHTCLMCQVQSLCRNAFDGKSK